MCPLLFGFILAAQEPPAAAPPQQAPAPQQAPPAPAPPSALQQPPPALPKVPDVRQPGETGWWAGVSVWVPRQHPYMTKGRDAAFTESSLITLQGKPKYAEGAELGFALGLHNALRLTYFETRATGSTTAGVDLHVWDQTYAAGTLVTTDYRLQNGKLSFDYLSWPYPVESRRFRFKTLWQVQWTSIRTGFDAPELPITDETGAPLVDASGNQITYAAQGTRWFISPEVGLGVAYFGGRRFRVEANAAGFTIPRHNSVWDADGSVNFRQGHFEVRVGARGFHFKTSTASDYYMRGTMYSGFIGLRWYSD